MPSRLAAGIAHFGTVQEFLWPALLVFQDNPTIRTIAIVGMILFHLNITAMFPLAVPLEWNLFMIFGILFLFGHYGDTPLSTLDDPLLIAVLAVPCVAPAADRQPRPDKISFLPSMRYYAGNWATSAWLFRKGSGAEERLDTHIKKPARTIVEQVGDIYDRETALYLLNRGLAFRAMHSHGRALNALLPHAVDDVEGYDVREGELISECRQRLELRRRPFPRAPSCSRPFRSAAGSRGRRAAGLSGVRADHARARLSALRDLGPRRRAARGGDGRGQGHGDQPAVAR